MESKRLLGYNSRTRFNNASRIQECSRFEEWPFCKTFIGARNAFECQKYYCQKIPSCHAFVYNRATNPPTCTIKTAYAVDKLEDSEDQIFGPKYCPGSMNSYNINKNEVLRKAN